MKQLGVPEAQINEETIKLNSGRKTFKDTLYNVVMDIVSDPKLFAEGTIQVLVALDPSLLAELEQNMPKIIERMRELHNF